MARLSTWLLILAGTTAVLNNDAFANPLGGEVVGGNATISGEGSNGVTIDQSSQNAIINWRSFNIGAQEWTRFNQSNAAAIALNRVTGDRNPSQILGSLSANGRVFLVNPEGFVFGPGASINTAGFLATTHDIRNEDFLAGRYHFDIPGNPQASIVNYGTITIADTGIAALVAPAVRNEGVITARLGRVALASNNGFSLDLYGDNLVNFSLDDEIAAQVIDVATGKPISSLVENNGRLSADGGSVAMTAVTARALVDSVINNRGVIEARSVAERNGRIVLGAQTAKRKRAGAPNQKVKVSGRIDASGKNGGESGGAVLVSGESIQLASATIDASGSNGGGKVLIGGDTAGGNANAAVASIKAAGHEANSVPTASNVAVDGASTIDVSASRAGDGGKAIVWADDATSFAGRVLARGGSIAGDGGFVEISGSSLLNFTGTVDLAAPYGTRGTLLLDPKDVTIASSGTWIVTPAAIEAALASGDVIVNTSAAGTDAGDITVAEDVNWDNDSTLTFSAHRDITLVDGVIIANSNAGSLVLRADDTGSGVGTVNMTGSAQIDVSASTGTVSIFYNPEFGYAFGTNYAPFVLSNPAITDQLTAYMLVNDVNDLQAINQNRAGNYALGRDIDASATASWNSGRGFVPLGDQSTPPPLNFDEEESFPNSYGPFVGIFDGQGHSIDGLIVNASTSRDAGLFGYTGASAQILRIGLTNISITGGNGASYGGDRRYVGGLVAENSGTITDSFVTHTYPFSSGGSHSS